MSEDFRAEPDVRYDGIIDGRLEPYGVKAVLRNSPTEKDRHQLIGLDGILWVYRTEVGGCLFGIWATGRPAYSILNAIQDEFGVEVLSEHDFRYCGCKTEEELIEWNRRQERLSSQPRI